LLFLSFSDQDFSHSLEMTTWGELLQIEVFNELLGKKIKDFFIISF